MLADTAPKRSVLFGLHLHAHDDSLLVGANSDRIGQGELVRLSAAEIERLACIGEQLAGEHLCTYEATEEAGQALFATVFRGAVLEAFLADQREAQRRGGWLRILVSLPRRTPLHEIPWEILHHDGRFLACSRVSIARYVRRTAPAPKAPAEPAVRMLLTSAEPLEDGALEVATEETKVRAGVAATAGRIQLAEADIRRHVSCDQLLELFKQARRSGRPYRIWHHSGHGRVTRSGHFQLALEERQQRQLVDGARLAQFVAAENDLQLAVLSICFSGSSLGLGVQMAALDVPAVVAFRGTLHNPVATRFADSFYRELGAAPVDVALGRARTTLGVSDDLDWAQPILYARSKRLSPFGDLATVATPQSATAPTATFHNRRLTVLGTARQVRAGVRGTGPRFAGTTFFNEDLSTGDLVQADLEAESGQDFATRWRELLDSVSGDEP